MPKLSIWNVNRICQLTCQKTSFWNAKTLCQLTCQRSVWNVQRLSVKMAKSCPEMSTDCQLKCQRPHSKMSKDCQLTCQLRIWNIKKILSKMSLMGRHEGDPDKTGVKFQGKCFRVLIFFKHENTNAKHPWLISEHPWLQCRETPNALS